MENLLPPSIKPLNWMHSGEPGSDSRANVLYELTDHVENRLSYSGFMYVEVCWPYWADGQRKYYIETQYGVGSDMTESARRKVLEKITPHLEALDITRDKINAEACREVKRRYEYDVADAARTRDRKLEELQAAKDRRKAAKMKYTDTRGVIYESAEEALEDFLNELPYLTDEEHETVFQFTSRQATAAENLQAIAYGVTYAGLDERFTGNNYPIPYPMKDGQK